MDAEDAKTYVLRMQLSMLEITESKRLLTVDVLATSKSV
jgi:hypothetical protein